MPQPSQPINPCRQSRELTDSLDELDKLITEYRDKVQGGLLPRLPIDDLIDGVDRLEPLPDLKLPDIEV